MILIQKNFLDKITCDEIIEVYNTNLPSVFKYRDTFPLCLYHNKFHLENISIKKILNKISLLCSKLDNSVKLDMAQIVKWPCGSKQDRHYDPPSDVFASILYLNDDYGGGETCFENLKIVPETGKLVIFSNNSLLHWVEEIKKTNRYTLALWFIKNDFS
jgi:hypothetical protein